MNVRKESVGTRPQEGGTRVTARAVGPASNPSAPEPFICKVEVAKRLGKTVRCIDNWMKRGLIPFFKIGRSVSFKWSDVEAHLAQTCRVCRHN